MRLVSIALVHPVTLAGSSYSASELGLDVMAPATQDEVGVMVDLPSGGSVLIPWSNIRSAEYAPPTTKRKK